LKSERVELVPIDIESFNLILFQGIKGTATATIIVSVIDKIGTFYYTIENYNFL
jgi:hypothetical protein